MSKALLYPLGQSISFGKLSLASKLLWTMLLPASDSQGRGLADPSPLKWRVCPNVNEVTPENIPHLLAEMVREEMIFLYRDHRERDLYQIINWWEYQKPQWAVPSKYDPPDGWIDRIRVQRGGRVTCEGWDTPGGFIQTPRPVDSESRSSPDSPPADRVPRDKTVALPDQADLLHEPPARPLPDLFASSPAVTPGKQPPGPPPGKDAGPPPGRTAGSPGFKPPDSIKQTKTSLNKHSAPGGAARPPPKAPPAVLSFRKSSHRFPAKSWYADLDRQIGRQPEDLEFWESVVKAWVGLGWNPQNVKGMLDYFQRRSIPGDDRKKESRTSTEPAGYAAIRQILQEENKNDID